MKKQQPSHHIPHWRGSITEWPFGKQFESFLSHNPTISHYGVFSFLWGQMTTQRVVINVPRQ